MFNNLDWIAFLSAGIQFILAFLGIVVSLHEEWAKRNKGYLITTFVALGASGGRRGVLNLPASTFRPAPRTPEQPTASTSDVSPKPKIDHNSLSGASFHLSQLFNENCDSAR